MSSTTINTVKSDRLTRDNSLMSILIVLGGFPIGRFAPILRIKSGDARSEVAGLPARESAG